MQGESGLNTSEDEDDLTDGNENMQPSLRIDVEGGVDGRDLEQERRVASQTNDDRGDMETEIGDSGRDKASGNANEDKTDHVDLVVPARKIKKPSPVWKCADCVPGGGLISQGCG